MALRWNGIIPRKLTNYPRTGNHRLTGTILPPCKELLFFQLLGAGTSLQHPVKYLKIHPILFEESVHLPVTKILFGDIAYESGFDGTSI